MSTTRRDLRQRLGLLIGDTALLTATGGSSSTLIDTNVTSPNNTWNGSTLVITSGSAAGDERYVSTWTQSTNTYAPNKNFSAAVASTNTYERHSKIGVTEKNNALNEAIRLSGIRWVRFIEDTSKTFTVNTYTYDISSLTVDVDNDWLIDEVWYDTGQSGTNPPYARLHRNYWDVRNNNETLTLQFDNTANDIIPSGKTLRLLYRARPAVFTADTSTGGTLSPDTLSFQNFIIYQAYAIIAAPRMLNENNPKGAWATIYRDYQKRADKILSSDKPQEVPEEVETMSWDQPGPYVESAVSRIRIP